jgi:hypothetical protein
MESTHPTSGVERRHPSQHSFDGCRGQRAEEVVALAQLPAQ